MAERPLEGRRIVVTRPREQAAELAEALEGLGATALVVPLIEVEPVELDALEVKGYDWIVFTSANAVDAVRHRLVDAGVGGVRLAAVGPATAEAARTLGVEPSFVPERYAADEIAAGLEPLEGRRVLLPQADIASPSLAEELRARGAAVDVVVVYRTAQVEPSEAEVAELARGVDAIVLASGSAARSLGASAARDVAARALTVCIGPKTAAVAREVGLRVGLVADEATSDGIIRALVSHFGESR